MRSRAGVGARGQAGDRFSLEDMEGKRVALADMKGRLWCDFWATWCGRAWRRCRILNKIYKEFEKEGLRFTRMNRESEGEVAGLFG